MSDDIKNLFKKMGELSESNENVVNLHDNFDLELSEHFVIETEVIGFEHDGVIVEADEATLEFLDLNGVLLEAEYQGKKVSLGKPFLTPDGPKKRSVYVKKPNGKVVKVNFGSKEMRIKKSNPERRKSFRARHKCATAKDRTSARYWSCKFW